MKKDCKSLNEAKEALLTLLEQEDNFASSKEGIAYYRRDQMLYEIECMGGLEALDYATLEKVCLTLKQSHEKKEER